MDKRRKAIQLSPDDVKYMLILTPEDIDRKLLEELFANKKSHEARFATYDFFFLPKGKLHNDNGVQTTVGRYIFNLHTLVPDNLINFTGYINTPMTDGNIGDLSNLLAKCLIEDKINTKIYMDYIDRIQWLGFTSASFINTSLTYNLLVPPKETDALKKQLFEKYKKEIEAGDIFTVNKIETALLADARSRIKDIPDLEIYDSGARGSFKNNYKNTSLMRGAIKNLADPTDVHISSSSLVEGIPPEDMPYYADIITQASYSRAVGTRDGGYESKKLSASFQNIVLDDKDSDCGSTKTFDTLLTKKNASDFIYRYIVVGGKLVLLNSDNISKYYDKVIHLRSPLYCKSPHYCNKCSGELFYSLGISNVGILTNRIGTSLLNSALKSFHDMSLSITEIDLDKYIE